MELDEKDIKKLSIIGAILILAVLVFILIKPVLLSIIGGLILAYIFYPVYKRINDKIQRGSLSAFLVTLIVILMIVIPLWFIVPLFIEQSFELFTNLQEVSIAEVVSSFLPTASEGFISQINLVFDTFVSKFTSGTLNSLINVVLDFPVLLLHLFLIGFVFFYALRDGIKLRKFISEISPLSKEQEFVLVKQFKDLTDSIVYGQVIIGLLQGISAGIGFLIFSIPNALVLTVLAIVLSIIPIIGPGLIWIPISIYLLFKGNLVLAIGFILYNAIIVSSLDNILRPYIVSKRTDISAVVVLIGMIGGIFLLGVIGLVLGPLILMYFITFLKAYREKTLGSMFRK